MPFTDCVIFIETYFASRASDLILEHSLDSEVAAYRRRITTKVEQIITLLMEQQAVLITLNEILQSNRRLIWARQRSTTFWDTDCVGFNDELFKSNFRMNRVNFVTLCTYLKSMEKLDTNMRKAISLEKRVAVALYALGSSAEYRSISNLFGVGKSTVCQIVSEFCDAVWNVLKSQYMNAFPLTEEKLNDFIRGFEGLGFPQCFGAIDGCHIAVHSRKEDAVDYYNYKGWYSCVLLALVDARYRFMYINVGSPGRCNDSMIFERSKLKAKLRTCTVLQQRKKIISGVNITPFILGDSAFRFSKNVMKPYPFTTANTAHQKLFNYKLSRCRRVVENAFGHLKARFRRVGKGIDNRIHNAPKIIKACCILHNFLNEKNDRLNKSWLRIQSVADKHNMQPEFADEFSDHHSDAKEIRQALTAYFAAEEVHGDSIPDGSIEAENEDWDSSICWSIASGVDGGS